MLRIARLLLVGSAAASLGLIAFIASQASALSPFLLLFVAAAVLFLLAASALERDVRRGKLLAVAGACALGGMGVLAGFGAGQLSFPFAALGALAAWCAVMVRAPRWVVVAFVVYLVVGVVLNAGRLGAYALSPFAIPTVLIWPLTGAIAIPGTGGLIAIFGAFGAALALTVAAYSAPRAFVASPSWRAFGRDALVGGLALVGLEVALAFANPSTSARYELVPVAIAILFVSGALLVVGVMLVRAGAPGGVLITVVAGAAVVYILTAPPTVSCGPNGAGSTNGPWWLPYYGGVSMSGGSGTSAGGSTGATGRIERGDGVVITYRCEGGALTEFEIRR